MNYSIKRTIVLMVLALFSLAAFAQATSSPMKVNQGESDAMAVMVNPDLSSPFTLRSWNLQFGYPTDSGYSPQAGIETDGNFFYVTQWNGTDIYKYDMNGIYVATLTIPGVTGLRDLAYDGTYFYGSNTTANIYEMDFTNQTLISTIVAPSGTAIRHIAYDSVNDAFWVGNWATDIVLVSRTGTVSSTIAAGTHGLASVYGTAFDNVTPGGPYLWAIDATSATDAATLYQIDIATGAQTGVVHDVIPDLGLLDGLGGGLFIHPDIITGTVTLGGLVQNQAIFGYDLTNLVDSIDLVAVSVLSPETGVGLAMEDVTFEITNDGLNAETNFSVGFQINGGTPVSETFMGTILPGQTSSYTFTVAADLSVVGTYKITAFASLNGDGDNQNDSTSSYVFSLGASSQRLVLIEHFTQASCGPCATQNPALDALITSSTNIDKVAHIAYHTSWPGVDPMYDFNLANSEDNARVDYYSVSGVPNCVIAGNQGQGLPSIVDQAAIDREYDRPGMFEITGTASYSPLADEISIDVDVKALCDFPFGDVMARVVLTEDVAYANPPGNNGETTFPDVMRRLFPDEIGTNLNNPSNNDITNINYTYVLQTPVEYVDDELEVVIFVQNDMNKDIYMTAMIPVAVNSGIEMIAENAISIYPNPSTGMLNVSNVDNSTVLIYNSLGSVVREIEVSSNIANIDLSDCSNGQYFIKVLKDNKVTVKSFSLRK
jgi:hypothetical protein